jgi:hypothetical protein
MVQQPAVGQGLLTVEASQSHSVIHTSHTQLYTPHIQEDSSRRVMSPTQRALHNNTQYSQETDIHAAGGVRSHDIVKRRALDRAVTGIGEGLKYMYKILHNA